MVFSLLVYGVINKVSFSSYLLVLERYEIQCLTVGDINRCIEAELMNVNNVTAQRAHSYDYSVNNRLENVATFSIAHK